MGNKSTAFTDIKSIRIDNNRIIDFSSPLIMGILNITPDSFYDGGMYLSNDDIVRKAERMLDEGADILDIGAVSTRPGAIEVNCDLELERLLNPLASLIKQFPNTIISIDTFRSRVAKEAVNMGAHIVNDISGGTMDELMFETIASLGVPYILMHINGTPQTMQVSPIEKNVTDKVKSFFNVQLDKIHASGISEVILDPGFGFGKTLESNYKLLADLESTRVNRLPILAGISRKSMINKVLGTVPQNALNGTTSLNTIALLNGANILRVHDVKEAKECVKLVDTYLNTTRNSQ